MWSTDSSSTSSSESDSSSTSSSDSDSSSISNLSSSSYEEVVEDFTPSKSNCTSITKWIVSGIEERSLNLAKKAFKPRMQTRSSLMANPILDDALYKKLKAVKRSNASKTDIDPYEKFARHLSFKILDIAKPLLYLANRCGINKKSESEVRAIRVALKLWAVLYNNVLQSRRRNIMTQLYPKDLHLLNDPRLVTIGCNLFGAKFVNTLMSTPEAQSSTNSDVKKQQNRYVNLTICFFNKYLVDCSL